MQTTTKIAIGAGAVATACFALALYNRKRKCGKAATACNVAGGVASATTIGLLAYSASNRGRSVLELSESLQPKVSMLSYSVGNKKPSGHAKADESALSVVIAILKKSDALSENTKSVMSVDIVNNLYKAEAKRMSLPEKVGIDGATIGRGQVSKAGYSDVLETFTDEMKRYSDEMDLAFSGNFKRDIANRKTEDFIVAFYLALCINKRQREGRSAEDAAKFGIGFYHGASNMIIEAQKTDPDILSFKGTEEALRKGTAKQQDLLRYIKEVLYGKN